MRKILLLTTLLLLTASCQRPEPADDVVPVPDPLPEEDITTYDWTSTVALTPRGEYLGLDDMPFLRDGKSGGIFYFLWHGAHGYDRPGGTGDVTPPSTTDVNCPYDISKLEIGHDGNAQSIPFGPAGAMHHWGEPYLGYYVGGDPWVLRKHAQLLTSAGVDAIILDMTNGFPYPSVFKTLVETYADLADEGSVPPKIICMLNASPQTVLPTLRSYYRGSTYANLWYYLDGKPLILMPEDAGNDGDKARFTIRYCWYDSQYGLGGDWWGDGSGKWTWGEMFPQRAVQEEMSVMAASHAHMYLGRSYSGAYGAGGAEPSVITPEITAEGRFFHQQWNRVLECDPDFVFVTGWNEFTAQRQINGSPIYWGHFMDKRKLDKGDTYFVDQYNHEFSRDIEPIADDFKDTYYYYLVEYVRRYKGVRPVEAVSETLPVVIDGSFEEWKACPVRYRDFAGDVPVRDYFGYGARNARVTNSTGRNDIVYSRVATDGTALFFNVETADPLSPSYEALWMRLYLHVDGASGADWEGFQYRVSGSYGRFLLQRSKGGWDWQDVQVVPLAAVGKELELSIPLSALGISSGADFAVEFKWIDNAVADGDIMETMRDGDSAPDARFRYRYIFKKAPL